MFGSSFEVPWFFLGLLFGGDRKGIRERNLNKCTLVQAIGL